MSSDDKSSNLRQIRSSQRPNTFNVNKHVPSLLKPAFIIPKIFNQIKTKSNCGKLDNQITRPTWIQKLLDPNRRNLDIRNVQKNAINMLTAFFNTEKATTCCDSNNRITETIKRNKITGTATGGSFKWTIFRVAISAATVYTIYKLDIWGSPDNSEKLLKSILNILQIPELNEPKIGLNLYRKYNESKSFVDEKLKKISTDALDPALDYIKKIFKKD